MRASKSIKLSLAVTVLLAACGSSSASSDTVAVKPKITVSSTNDPTSVMLSEIYAQALEKAEFRVARKKAYDTPEALYAAMQAGDVQLTGATTQQLFAWAEKQKGSTDALPATTALQTVAIAKALPASLKLGQASTAEDKAVIFCAATFTQANTIATLTDLGTKPQTATLAAPDGFDTATPLGAAALKDTYQIQFKSVVPTAADGIVAAVTGGKADCGVGRSGDPALAPVTLTVLQDDKALVPNDVMLSLVTTAAGTPDVLTVVDAASTRLTTEQLRSLEQRLKDGASPELAANEFTGNAGQ
ncbi:MAG: glycine betaine ABC transporter substrate-binding protein [Ilumatobacteraceae bacterium]